MVSEVVLTLLLLNFTHSSFFSGQNGSFSIEINQPVLPTNMFVDFGDSSFYDSRLQPSTIAYFRKIDSFILTIWHVYKYFGMYDMFFNISNSVSVLEHWTTVVVEERISGVELSLLGPSIVALLEDVSVTCTVEKGTNLGFEWDFGDDSDGQYTREDRAKVDGPKTVITAHHSYGIADSYRVSVHIFNNYEDVVEYINVTIRAVEPIEQLHFQTRIPQQFAAPIYKRKANEDFPNALSTVPVEFEAWVWRGSDVQFHFNFGDGNIENVSSQLNAWSLPYAFVEHVYNTEGIYEVFVTATNLLSSVSKSLEQPFYVQFPPESLLLDKQFYIIEHDHNLTLHATITQGTNVSFNWKMGDIQMMDAGNSLFLPYLNPGVHIIFVEAYNHVTDFGSTFVRRPNATGKIYVQEKLLDVQICIVTSIFRSCDAEILDLPLDEEVHFIAEVIPTTETALRFIWQLEEIRQTNVPFYTHKYQQAGLYSINMTVQNHISSMSSKHVRVNMIQKVANLTSIFCQGPNLVNHPITCRALYWFGTDLTFQWDFGDNSDALVTTSSSVQHVYKEAGEYWITVNAWNRFSSANLSTNKFFLNHMCQKPDVAFLHQRNRFTIHDRDILIEADVSILCTSSNVSYTWILKDSVNATINIGKNITQNQRQLVIPSHVLEPGNYNIELKVNMVGTIVYATSSTSLAVVQPSPLLSIRGGFVRWMGMNDTIELIADSMHLQQPLNYTWSCISLSEKHLPCFKDPGYLLNFNNSSKMTVSSSALTAVLGAVVINVTDQNNKLVSSSQVLEISPLTYMLHVDIECDKCSNHHVDQQDRIQVRAVCKNCGNAVLEYRWKIWMLNDRMHFNNYLCVQADGSTFYIVAPNSSDESSLLNATFKKTENVFNTPDEHMLSEKPHEVAVQDMPPFPTLPGFPEESNTNLAHNLVRTAREAPLDSIPLEGDAQYYNNSTYIDFLYPNFLDSLPLSDPDYLIAEEGLPGESGSAAARNQGLPNLGILSEDNDDILEGAGKPRLTSSGSNNVLVDGTFISIDPLRDRLNRKSSLPHIISRSRNTLHLRENDTTTGLNAEYLVLKPGLLNTGKSYLIEAKVVNRATKEEGLAMEYLKVNVGPVNGRCTLMPVEGYSISFDFRLHCLEWKSDNLPLYYELRYSRIENEVGHLVYFGLNGNVKFNLPAGFTSDSQNVYLDVIVRDNLGASTNVCSLIRKVYPFQTNISLENYVFNETFHPGSTLKKLVGEKHNQAVLQKLHVLASSLNSHKITLNVSETYSESYSIRSKIKQEFLEIIRNLKISSKVEATQIVSILKEIISDFQSTNAFELQKVYNLYKQVHSLVLSSFFANEQLQVQNQIFLSKLAFAAHSIQPRSEELIHIASKELINESKDSLIHRLQIEKPLQINILHLSSVALYVSENMLSPIHLKKSEIQFLGNPLSVLKYHTRDLNSTDKCLMFFAYEYDYLTSFDLPYNTDLPESYVFYTLHFCDDKGAIESSSPNISINFLRPHTFQNSEQIPLMSSHMNVHIFNITEKLVGQSFLFFIRFSEENKTEANVDIDVMLRFKDYPTMKDYDFKRSHPASSMEINFFLPPSKLKDVGLYYISVMINKFQDERSSSEDIVWAYEVSAWTDVCLGKKGGHWSNSNCQIAETTNSNSTHCLCSVQKVAAYSTPLEGYLMAVPISNIVEPFFNPLCLSLFVILHLLCFMLLYLNYQKDKLINGSCSPVPLRDNNPKHRQFYLLVLKTGFFFNSGTTASVFVVLYGTKDVTETRQLVGVDAKKIAFQKGSVDVFILNTEKSLGPLLKVDVWHNNKGSSPSWYLKTICIQDLKTGLVYNFDCYNWLSAEMDLIERELTVAENHPKFTDILYENLVTFTYDLSTWNAVVVESPASFFTGVQRIICCLCFTFNCALLLTLLQEVPQEVKFEEFNFSITHKLYLTSFIVALWATIPQFIVTILLKFSCHPTISINPKFRDIFHWLAPYNINCWLRPKRSNSSSSTTGSSSSLEGRDSLYRSLDSIVSESHFPDQSTLSHGEKDNLSFLNLSDPVSPLQKTLSTWKLMENWLRQKQDAIPNSDSTQSKRQSCLLKTNSVSLNESSFYNIDQNNSVNDTSNAFHSSFSASSSQSNIDLDTILKDKSLGLSFHFPIFPSYFHFLGWGMMLINLTGIYFPVVQELSRFSMSFSILFFKQMLISIVFSSLILTPLIIFVIALIYSVKMYIQSCEQFVPLELEDLPNDNRQEDHNASSYWRIEYFKKYLRPPKEQALLQFRQIAMREKIVSAFYSDLCKHTIVLILLLASIIPESIPMKYLQRKSIENTLFRSFPPSTKLLHSKQLLLNWLEIDFLDTFLAEHHCHSMDEDNCGESILVGSVILRHFYLLSGLPNRDIYGGSYERRSLKGIVEYFIENKWHILSDKRFYSYDELQSFVDRINASSAASIEFLLFNPAFSFFTSVSILFEATKTGSTSVTYDIVTLEILAENRYFCMLFFNSLLFLFVLFMFKNQVWKVMKHKLEYWKRGSNYLSCLFILAYFGYISFFTLHIIMYQTISLKLINTQLKANINIIDIVMSEAYVYCFSGLLIYIHMFNFIKILSYNYKINQKIKRLLNLCKNILPAFIIFIIVLLSYIFINRFLGVNSLCCYPLFGFAKVINLLFKDYGKPEVQNPRSLFGNIFHILILVLLIFLHLYIFALLRSVLLNSKSVVIVGEKNEGISLKLTRKVLKKKFLSSYLGTPQTSCEDCVLPLDFLLFELEQLGDALISKADNLFPELNEQLSHMESDLISECEKQLLKDEKMEQSDVDFLNRAFDTFHGESNDQFGLQLQIKTVPELVYPTTLCKQAIFLPFSFHTSLNWERNLTAVESPSSLQPNRIRKTYPLYQLDSDSALHNEFNSSNVLSIRRTKSRGKFKNENLNS